MAIITHLKWNET